ncbi:hypothetical protein D3C80_1403010 [compost metagenome]
MAKPGVAAGGDHNGLRRAAHHGGPHKAQGIAFERIGLLRVTAARHFLDRQRFAGERSLRDKQIACLDDAQIGRDHVACREFNDIAHHQLIDRQLKPGVFAFLVDNTLHGGGVADHRFQGVSRTGRPRFLNEIQQCRDGDHQRNHASGEQIFRGIGNDTQRSQQQVERVAVAQPQVDEPR